MIAKISFPKKIPGMLVLDKFPKFVWDNVLLDTIPSSYLTFWNERTQN